MKSDKFQAGETAQCIKDMRNDISRVDKKVTDGFEDMNTRLSALEKWRWLLTGAIIALGVTEWPQIAKIVQQIAGKLLPIG